MGERERENKRTKKLYVVASISRLIKNYKSLLQNIIFLYRALLQKRHMILKEPTSRSHPIARKNETVRYQHSKHRDHIWSRFFLGRQRLFLLQSTP